MAWAPTIRPPAISKSVVRHLLVALVAINREWLEAHAAPSLYGSGIVYRREPKGLEDWLSIPEVLARGHGDCEDLAAWRVAELQHAGELNARVRVDGAQRPDGSWLFHITVTRADGTQEDPSEHLGMKTI